MIYCKSDIRHTLHKSVNAETLVIFSHLVMPLFSCAEIATILNGMFVSLYLVCVVSTNVYLFCLCFEFCIKDIQNFFLDLSFLLSIRLLLEFFNFSYTDEFIFYYYEVFCSVFTLCY